MASLPASARNLYAQVRNYPLKRRFDADITQAHTLAELGHAADGRENYVPSRFVPTLRSLRRLRLGPDDHVADLGAGKGLGVLLAAEHPVKRVVGVELVADLADVARENVSRNRDRLRARDVEIVTGDVLQWPIPDDLTVVYLYSPFFGEVFATVLDRVLESLERRPRPLRVVYTYPREHERLMSTGRAQLLDVTSAFWPSRRSWWREPHVIATYGLGDGPFPHPAPPLTRSRALRAWRTPVPAVEWVS